MGPGIQVAALLGVVGLACPSFAAVAALGLSVVQDEAPEAVLDDHAGSLAVCFEAGQDLEALSAAFYCSRVQSPASVLIRLHRESRGVPGQVLGESSGVVPQARSWILGNLEGVPLARGRRYCLVLSADTLRGGAHPVDRPSPDRFCSFLALKTDAGPGPSFFLIQRGSRWERQETRLLWALHGRGRRIQGFGWTPTRPYPIHGAGSPQDPKDDLWQAQVFHFSCAYSPVALRARIRKIGQPLEPLRYALLKHEYLKGKTSPLLEGVLAGAEDVGGSWKWHEAKLPSLDNSLSPECHYLALRTVSGRAEEDSCRDCYEISGARVQEGLELAQELSFGGGAHRNRASASLNGQGWADDFSADLNLVLVGPPCRPSSPAAAPRLLPTPAPFEHLEAP